MVKSGGNTWDSADSVTMTMVTDNEMAANIDDLDHRNIVGLNNKQGSSSHLMQNLCNQQIGDQFGCTPLEQFVTYQGPEVHWKSIPDIFQAHRLIKDSGLPNFLGMRIPVQTNLNVSNWRRHLVDYFDQQLPDLIQFAFPLDFDTQEYTVMQYFSQSRICY